MYNAMNFISKARLWSLVCTIGFLLTLLYSCSPRLPNNTHKPNIIYIVTDDQDTNSLQYMPIVQKELIQKGVSFQHAIVSSSVCCPSRVSVLRGQYVHNHKVYTSDSIVGGFARFRALERQNSTVATWLHDAGYRTAFMGKYLNGYGYPNPQDSNPIPPGWDEWHGVIASSDAGSQYYNYLLNSNGQIVDYSGTGAYEAFTLEAFALKFIKSAHNDEQPFFLYLAPFAPHGPTTVPPDYAEGFEDVQAPRSPSFNEADVSDKPRRIRGLPLLTQDEIDAIDETYRKRLRSLVVVNEIVGNIISELASHGILDNTYIFYTSDNGYHLGEHRLKPGKSRPYEEDIHVPLIVRGPEIKPGQTIDELVLNSDFAPTFAEIAGATIPDFVDGRSLMPLLSQQSQNWRKSVFFELWSSPDKIKPVNVHRGLRTTDSKLIIWDTGEIELYDLLKDPYELNNIASENPEEVEKLRTHLAKLSTCQGIDCRFLENATP